MKVNEFRIGNLISDGFFIYKILEISKGIVKGFSTQNGEFFYPDTLYSLNEENLEGIPLTEEWLLKFGFNNINSKEYGIKCGSCWMSLSNPKDMGEWQDCYCWIFDRFKFIELKYVHQLQNLYFALTKEELEINKEDEKE